MSRTNPGEMDNDPPQGNTGTCGCRLLILVLILLMLLALESVVAGAYTLFPFCCLPLLILAQALLRPDAGGPADDGEGPDDDGGPPPTDVPPNSPGGGLLLPTPG
jgi:hypothetical protein